MRLHGMMTVFLLLAFGTAADWELAPLEIELPEPAFGGEPLSYYGPNLEPLDYRNRPPLYAPKGTSNIALRKPVTSSAAPLNGVLEQITDGDKHYWRTSVVTLPEGLQWIQVDLEEEHNIYAIVLWHFHENVRVYFSVIVQISSDKDFVDGVITVFNNDFDDVSGFGAGKDKNYVESHQGRLIDTGGISGRYVRLYSDGNHKDDFNHYIEVEVYGQPKIADKSDGKKCPENTDALERVPIKIELPEPAFM